MCSELEKKRRPGDVFGTEELALNRLLEFGGRLHTQGLEGIADLADRLFLGI
jgi:hypothetical protein